MATSSTSIEGIKRRTYCNFRGVDFTGGTVPYYRSPDGLNMYRDYSSDDDSIETRPGMTYYGDLTGKIYGMHFITIDGTEHCLIHKNTQLVEWTNYPNKPMTVSDALFTGMNPSTSKSFIFDDTLFIIDGINYLEYDGTTVKEVEGTIPYTSYYRNPDGSSDLDDDTDTDTVYQPVNYLTSKRRNRFIGDGKSQTFYLDSKGLDSAAIYLMTGTIVGTTDTGSVTTEITENVDFTVDREKGTITFTTITPAATDYVTVTLSKTTEGYANRLKNCKLVAEYDNRFFFAGNPNYPNMVYHCQLNDPRYVPDILQNSVGIDFSEVKALIPGNNLLWIIKDTEQEQTSLHYLTGTYADDGSRCYQDVDGSVNLGCVSTGINFNDDIVYFSKRGLEGISTSSLYSEQILNHRSSNVDSKLLADSNYTNVKLAEWNGYLLCLTKSNIYVADSRQKFTNGTNEIEYEWFFWNMQNNITFIKEHLGSLYMANDSGEFYLLDGTVDEVKPYTDTDGNTVTSKPLISYWTTKKEDFDFPAYSKTTNKKGNVVDLKKMDNDSIMLYTIKDGTEIYKKTYSDTKGYFPFKIKEKKFKNIQLKFYSEKRFGISSCTLEGFVAGYIKR